MKPVDRWRWIAEQMKADYAPFKTVDILNRYFVDVYEKATGAKVIITWFGANKCPQLARDLKDMYDGGILKRWRNGIGDMGCDGFPKWVWSYELIPGNWLLDKPRV